MPGIEILAEYTEGGQPVAALTVLGILSLIFLALTVLQLVNDEPGSSAFCGFSVGFLMVFLILMATAEPEHTRYKVLISEDVKLVEFLEQYEILDTEGEIHTIREVIPDA